MLTLLSLEIFKLRKKPRSYLGPAGLFGIAALMGIGLRYGPAPEHAVVGAAPRGVLIVGSPLTAGFMAALIMEGTFMLFVPLFVSMVAGDAISGEASDGTLRTALSRPIGRSAFYAAKLAASSLYAVFLSFLLLVSSYLIGLIALGRGSMAVAWAGFAIYPEGEALVRLIGAYALACVPMITVASIALLISATLNSSPAAIVVPVILMIGLMVISEINFFQPAKPYFFTTYMDVWKQAFAPQPSSVAILKGIGALFAYTVVCGAIGAALFRRKDILT